MNIDVWILNVGRGFCAAIRSPNGYLCLIDCGCSDEFSPVEWLARQQWTLYENHKLTKLIITHPHEDHVADIQKISEILSPRIIKRKKDIDWRRATTTPITSHYKNHYCPGTYTNPASDPDWGDGMTLQSFSLNSAESAQVSTSDNSYMNNMSIVSILIYRGYTFAFPGDIESEGMVALLRQSQDLKSAISSGIDFFITPHHGHTSGFSSEWFEIAGPTNKFNIASERRRHAGEDESQTRVDSRYSQDAYCEGVNQEGRKLVSTRSDGHVHIWINDDGTWGWEAS